MSCRMQRESERLSVCLSTFQSIGLFVHPSVLPSLCPSVCHSIYPSICLSIHPSIRWIPPAHSEAQPSRALDGQMVEWMDEWMDGWMNGWVDRRIDGCLDGQMTDRWRDGELCQHLLHCGASFSTKEVVNLSFCFLIFLFITLSRRHRRSNQKTDHFM